MHGAKWLTNNYALRCNFLLTQPVELVLPGYSTQNDQSPSFAPGANLQQYLIHATCWSPETYSSSSSMLPAGPQKQSVIHHIEHTMMLQAVER